MRIFFLTTVFLLCMLNVVQAESYDNRDYGSHIELPGDETVCLTPSPAADSETAPLWYTQDLIVEQLFLMQKMVDLTWCFATANGYRNILVYI